MLEVHPIESKEKQQEICKLCNIEFNADALCYGAYVDGKIVGCSQFSLKEDAGEIYDIENTADSDDENALFVIGRATLNFIDLCGTHFAKYIGTSQNKKLLRLIGFCRNENDEWVVNLEGFFDAPCCHDPK